MALVRNNERESMRSSLRQIEERFNRRAGYPWVFMNNEPFTEDFKKGMTDMTRSECIFRRSCHLGLASSLLTQAFCRRHP